jgi:hypothetical protein
MRGLVAGVALLLLTSTAQAQRVNQEDAERLEIQIRLLNQTFTVLSASLPREMPDFQCANNLLHTSLASLSHMRFMHSLIVLSSKMRDPSDKAAVYAMMRGYTEMTITMVQSTKEYIDTAIGPCRSNFNLSMKANDVRHVTGNTLTILNLLRGRLRE